MHIRRVSTIFTIICRYAEATVWLHIFHHDGCTLTPLSQWAPAYSAHEALDMVEGLEAWHREHSPWAEGLVTARAQVMWFPSLDGVGNLEAIFLPPTSAGGCPRVAVVPSPDVPIASGKTHALLPVGVVAH